MIRVNLQFSYMLLIYFLFLVLIGVSQADDIGIYWGEEDDVESLAHTCSTGKYSHVKIAGLDTFGNGRTPKINLGRRCDPYINGCTVVSSDIKNCQKKGIKVMLSIGGASGTIDLTSSEDAKNVSEYLWNNFLGGNSSSRPLGDAILDGIDFFPMGSLGYWGDLARYLKSNTTPNVHLSASLLCHSEKFAKSILNSGIFDHITVLFMGNPSCKYKDGNPDIVISSWNQWAMLKVGKIFLGLSASPDAVFSGYIPIALLNSQILPVIRKSSKYGGITLWSRESDKQTGYSDSIKILLCKLQSPPQCNRRGIKFTESFGYMSMASFTINESDGINHHCCGVICSSNCSCDAYAPTNYATNTGCQIWSKESTFNRSSGSNGQKIYIANKEGQEHTPGGSNKSHAVIWIVTSVGAALAITFICYLSCVFWRKYKAEVDTRKRQKKLIHDIGGNAMLSKMNYTAKKIKKEGNTSDEIEIFSFESMVIATNNFSASNKLGEGGFGSVYMGRLTNQQEIAIKRLSRSSGQGLTEFKNEAKLIAKLQHTNLVRLIGLCIQREERMLIYEYMPNGSLDFHLFDAERRNVLNWEKRHNIIEGIAQGLLYLHKYSRLKVIHRDLKAGNILLDEEMKPKISDFGMARILGLKSSEEKTNRIVGTYGYMSPEYALNGIVSAKIDVFSFGVLLLEILSGKKNNSSYDLDSPLSLIGYAWKLWNEGRALELMDPRLNETCTPNEALRCMQIGLLCVQDHATNRPNMLDVVSFLSNDGIQLAQPKQPAFFINVDTNRLELPGNRQERYSINSITISNMDGR